MNVNLDKRKNLYRLVLDWFEDEYMKRIGSYEAKTHLPKLLKKVTKGSSFIITKHGMPVAELVPPRTSKKHDIGKVIAEIKDFRKGKSLKGLSIKKIIAEGRRY